MNRRGFFGVLAALGAALGFGSKAAAADAAFSDYVLNDGISSSRGMQGADDGIVKNSGEPAKVECLGNTITIPEGYRLEMEVAERWLLFKITPIALKTEFHGKSRPLVYSKFKEIPWREIHNDLCENRLGRDVSDL